MHRVLHNTDFSKYKVEPFPAIKLTAIVIVRAGESTLRWYTTLGYRRQTQSRPTVFVKNLKKFEIFKFSLLQQNNENNV